MALSRNRELEMYGGVHVFSNNPLHVVGKRTLMMELDRPRSASSSATGELCALEQAASAL